MIQELLTVPFFWRPQPGSCRPRVQCCWKPCVAASDLPHRFLLKQHLEQINALEESTGDIDMEVGGLLELASFRVGCVTVGYYVWICWILAAASRRNRADASLHRSMSRQGMQDYFLGYPRCMRWAVCSPDHPAAVLDRKSPVPVRPLLAAP